MERMEIRVFDGPEDDDPRPLYERLQELEERLADACARCGRELDDDGFCSECGAVTLAGRLLADKLL